MSALVDIVKNYKQRGKFVFYKNITINELTAQKLLYLVQVCSVLSYGINDPTFVVSMAQLSSERAVTVMEDNLVCKF